jgi:hypothetical protein
MINSNSAIASVVAPIKAPAVVVIPRTRTSAANPEQKSNAGKLLLHSSKIALIAAERNFQDKPTALHHDGLFEFDPLPGFVHA